jgi:SAM-dependent methyltransferase
MLESTGERLVPDRQRGQLVHAEHLARYFYAAPLARDRVVLDAACGEGYGTAILGAAGAASVVGVDVDEATVEHAHARHGIDVRRADVADLPFDDGAFDLVVSFETIEHVAEPERALAEMRRVLRPEGTLVISTPNPAEYLVSSEFHVRDFAPDEFERLLHSHFEQVEFAYQQNWVTSALLDAAAFATADEGTPLDVDLRKTVAGEPGRQLYTIAVCGGAGAGDLRAVAVAAGLDEAHRLSTDLGETRRLVREWNGRAVEAERLVGEWNARALEAERQLDEARAARREVEESLSWRLTAPLRALRALRALRRRRS